LQEIFLIYSFYHSKDQNSRNYREGAFGTDVLSMSALAISQQAKMTCNNNPQFHFRGIQGLGDNGVSKGMIVLFFLISIVRGLQ
jgi:hypothetical protein